MGIHTEHDRKRRQPLQFYTDGFPLSTLKTVFESFLFISLIIRSFYCACAIGENASKSNRVFKRKCFSLTGPWLHFLLLKMNNVLAGDAILNNQLQEDNAKANKESILTAEQKPVFTRAGTFIA